MPTFQSIPFFTPNGSYEIDVSLNHLVRSIEGYKQEYNLDMDPDFQRGHVWTQEQQIRFIEFILRGGRSARIIYFNHPAWHRGDVTRHRLVLVDGKQRLNAALRFMNNEIPAFGHLRSEYTDQPDYIRSSLRFCINDLKTRRQVLQWYLDLNTGGVVHTSDEIEKVKALLAQEPDFPEVNRRSSR